MKLCGMHEKFEKMDFCEKDDYKMIIKPSYMLSLDASKEVQ
jgi:hypothetical protein